MTPGTYPALEAVLAGPIPALLEAEWQRGADAHRASGEFAASFHTVYPHRGNPLACAVFNDAMHARILEEGHAGFHLPSRIDWSGPKVKTTAKGKRYIIVPFGHGTPGSDAGGVSSGRRRAMMTPEVYGDALTALQNRGSVRQAKLAAERLQAAGTRLSRPYALMAGVPRALVRQALRTEVSEVTGAGQPGYTWRARTYEGLTYRKQVNPVTGRSSGSYKTFRILMEGSAGWFIPAMPGFHLAADAVRASRGPIRALVAEAGRADAVERVAALIGGEF